MINFNGLPQRSTADFLNLWDMWESITYGMPMLDYYAQKAQAEGGAYRDIVVVLNDATRSLFDMHAWATQMAMKQGDAYHTLAEELTSLLAVLDPAPVVVDALPSPIGTQQRHTRR